MWDKLNKINSLKADIVLKKLWLRFIKNKGVKVLCKTSFILKRENLADSEGL